MKLRIRLSVVGLLVALLVPVFFMSNVNAQATLTNDQLEKISANCSVAKTTLNQLHASDALLRVNRGQLYEAISSRLMNNFNARLTSNNLDARGLQVVTTSYRTALDNFRNDYQIYERQLSAAIKIDCDKQPAEFHYAVEDAREKRAKVHEDVQKLHQFIDDYRSAVNDFYINYERVTGAN